MIKFISVPGNTQAEKLWLTKWGEWGEVEERKKKKRIQQSCNGMNIILE